VEVEWDHASVWSGTAGSWVDLHYPAEASRSGVFGIHGGRQVGFATTRTVHAALWSGSPESYVNLHPPGAAISWGYGIWGDQQVGTVTLSPDPQVIHACLWHGTAESWTDLHPAHLFPRGWSMAFAVCQGRQVGTVCPTSGATLSSRAALWSGSADSYVDLHAFLPDGYSKSEAWGIDVSGERIWVVGFAYNAAAGRDEAVMWYLPEPGTAALLAVGAIGLLAASLLGALRGHTEAAARQRGSHGRRATVSESAQNHTPVGGRCQGSGKITRTRRGGTIFASRLRLLAK